ncbi:CCA tRNA nucleotidyltransferase, mitochondrial [Paramarasmius palmivorus]|uniref:CCA tRNA nucleotidyltransferase, mitochondrial n=1 Tax=Paramarasmius palmivorus TaxID=297713 RepID=A0AAW0BTP9_9AGAR
MSQFIPFPRSPVDRVFPPPEMVVELTEVEEKICVLLDNCKKYLEAEKGIGTECRIAGGWVRDKLLGSQSNDLDVALSNIMGFAFAEHLAEFAKDQGMEVGSIGKIAQNPDQSKHLETATFKILGRDLDLVNLRSEEYATGSRIPTGVSFGTPEQDALRRDITINALFYNCHTRSVEDCTGKGLDDLRNGIVRTPLAPRETFIDDPLRVLRCIRFASRFGFDMVPEIEEAVKEPEIRVRMLLIVFSAITEDESKEALVKKVARERAGEELSKMVKGRSPLRSLQLIISLGLYESIFAGIPSSISSTTTATPASHTTALKAATILQTLLTPNGCDLPPVHPTLLKAVSEDPTCKSRLFLATYLSPYLGILYIDHKKKQCPLVEYVIRECLKLGTQNHFLDGIPALFTACQLLKGPDLSDERFKVPSERAAIGTLLREKAVHNVHTGSHWTSSLLFSLTQELVPLCDTIEQGLLAGESKRIIDMYNTFVQRIEELDLDKAVDAKHLLDGREVVSTLGAKPGPWTGQVLARVMTWQLENPQGTKDDCVAWLKNEQAAGNLTVGNTISGSEPANKRVRTH